MVLTIIILITLLTIATLVIYNFHLYEMRIQELRKNNKTVKIIKDTEVIEPPIDPLINYDMRVINDPLQEPKRRPARDIIGPIIASNPIINPMLNIATRGYPDNFTQQGYLVDHKNKNKNDANMIIPLFGRQKYPQSVEYEYYIVMNIGGFERKYMLDKQKRELYDGDKVYIDILKKQYETKLFKTQGLEYNPFLL